MVELFILPYTTTLAQKDRLTGQKPYLLYNFSPLHYNSIEYLFSSIVSSHWHLTKGIIVMHDSNASQNTSSTTLGRYKILQRIGKGGMGDVWLCEDPMLRRQVAIKTLPSHNQSDREFVLRFEREAQAAAALNHPHIVPVHDYGQQPLPNGQSITYIVMPYISDGSLDDRIAACKAKSIFMATHESITYLVQAADAIDYAHQQGLIHRDIKPANMLLRADNWLLLADFGIARILASTDKLTQTGLGFGTPRYMSPEQAQGKAEFASDNYSLAVIAYQLFAGRVPFDADTAYATTMQHMMLPPPSPRQFNPSISLALESALLKGLEKQPGQRPPSARAFVDMLQQSLSGASPSAPPNIKITPPPITAIAGPQNSSPQAITMPQSFPMQKTLVDNHQTKPPVASKLDATRRRLLIGGGAAFVVAGSGLGIWAILPKATSQPSIQAKPTTAPAAPTTDQPLVLRGHNKPVANLAWSPAGILASSGSSGDPQVFLWDIQALYQQKGSTPKPKTTRQFQTGQDILLAWSPQGDMLAIANAENGSDFNSTKLDIYAGDLSAFAPGYSDTFIIKDNLVIDALAWSPSENFLTITHPGLNLDAKSILRVWNAKQPQQTLASFDIPRRPNTGLDTTLVNTPMAIAAHTSPLNLALATSDGISVEQITFSTPQPQFKESNLLTYDNDKFTSGTKVVVWSSDGRYLAGIKDIYSKPTSIGIWDLQTSTIPSARVLPDDANTFLITIAWSGAPASTRIAAGGDNGKIYIWDSNGNTLPIDVKTLPSDIQGGVRALVWSADGQWLAAAYNDQNDSIVVWKM